MKLGMIFLAILLIADTIQIARFGEIVERVDGYNKGVVDELGGFRQDIMSFGSDMNEIRNYLLLPTKDYSFIEKDTEIDQPDEKVTSTTEMALYSFMGGFIDEQNATKNAMLATQRIDSFSADADLAAQLETVELSIGKVEKTETSAIFKINSGTESLFAITADQKTGVMSVQSAMGSYILEGEDDASVKAALIKYLTTNKDKVLAMKQTIETQKTLIASLKEKPDVENLLNEKNLTMLLDPVEDDTLISFNVINNEEDVLLSISIKRENGKIMIKDKELNDEATLLKALLEELGKLDGASAMEKLINERRAELEAVFNDDAFKVLLESNNFTVATEPREEYNKLLYDVKNADGNVQFSFVIELSSGLFKVLKDDTEIDLYSILQEGSKKKP